MRAILSPLVDAVEMCLEKRFMMPALILIYSGIDIVGGLAREESDRNRKEDFTNWVDRYMLPDPALDVSSM